MSICALPQGTSVGSTREPSSPSITELEEEFHATRVLYNVLLWRQCRSPLFLLRCLQGASKGARRASQRRPSVRYTCGYKSFRWFQDVPKLGCLWCYRRRCVRFQDCFGLLQHLRNCHGRFQYICDQNGSGRGSECLVVIEVKLLTGREGILATRIDKFRTWDVENVYVKSPRLQRCKTTAASGRDSAFHATPGETENLKLWKTTRFVTRRLTVNSEVLSKGPRTRKRDGVLATENDYSAHMQLGLGFTGSSARQNLFAYSKNRFAAHLKRSGSLGQDVLDDYVSIVNLGPPCMWPKDGPHSRQSERKLAKPSARSSDREPPPRNELSTVRTAEITDAMEPRDRNGVSSKLGKPKDTPSRQRSTGKRVNLKLGEGVFDARMAFPSIDEGINQGILYQSVIQSRLTLEGFEAGEDSDGDDIVVDEHWRLELNDRTLSEYLDTSAPEKMYMNLWNRFSMCEFFVYSDRRLLKALSTFARQYGAVLDALRLEILFLRHLTELSRLGLIDASGIHETIVEYGKAKAAVAEGSESIEERLATFEFLSRVLSEEGDIKNPPEEILSDLPSEESA